jgi:fibronectin-binding autotransporter adhesin
VFGIDANASGSTTAQTLTFLGGADNALGTSDLIYLSAATTGTITFGGAVNQGSLTLQFNGNAAAIDVANAAANLVLGASSAVAGTGGLSTSGAGTLTLAGANTYTGDTVVSAGTLGITGTINTAGNNFTVDGTCGE